MHTSFLKRIIIGFCFAIPLGLLTFTVGEARNPVVTSHPSDCLECHEDTVTRWKTSGHGQATEDPNFVAAWNEAGNAEDCLSCHTTGFDAATGHYEQEGITCATCHTEDATSHPEQIMNTDASSRFCGTCHVDTMNELAISGHGQEDMACVNCHNPHTNELKAGGVQDTCIACHNEESHFFSFTPHAQEGLLCTDCHLRVEETTPGEGHSQRLHTFQVGLETCNDCHGQDMHFSEVEDSEEAAQLLQARLDAGDIINTAEECTIMEAGVIGGPEEANVIEIEPEPTNPYNFALLAAVIGMAFGLVGSPWLERWYRRIQEDNDQE